MSATATATEGDTRHASMWVASASGEGAVGMVLLGVRQWRFAPARAAIAALLLAVAVALLLGYPTLAVTGSRWALVIVCGLLAIVLTIGRVPGAWPARPQVRRECAHAMTQRFGTSPPRARHRSASFTVAGGERACSLLVALVVVGVLVAAGAAFRHRLSSCCSRSRSPCA
jgi:hypothetical protein